MMEDLYIWCQEKKLDPVTEIFQRRPLELEEYQNGWVRMDTVSGQQVNELLYLLSSRATCLPCTPELVLSSDVVPDTAVLWVNGGVIDETETPILFERYGTTFPTLTAPSGWKYIVRKQ